MKQVGLAVSQIKTVLPAFRALAVTVVAGTAAPKP
jgi:hypothetical protein